MKNKHLLIPCEFETEVYMSDDGNLCIKQSDATGQVDLVIIGCKHRARKIIKAMQQIINSPEFGTTQETTED